MLIDFWTLIAQSEKHEIFGLSFMLIEFLLGSILL